MTGGWTLRGPQETVIRIVRVNVGSGDRADGVDGSRKGLGALEGTCARPRGVEGGDSAVRSAHEAVIHIARVRVPSRDRPLRIDGQWLGALEGTCARARGIEGGGSAVRSAHEAVIHIVRVRVQSRDRPRRVDAVGDGALELACARARNIEGGESAVRETHVGVTHIV